MQEKLIPIINKYDKKIKKNPSIDINELPQYSKWPVKLLGLEEFSKKNKTKEDILREYNKEKWAILLEQYNAKKWESLNEFIDSIYGDEESPFFWKGDIFKIRRNDYHKLQLNFIKDLLSIFIPAVSIIELGSGWGDIILALASDKKFKNINIIGGELAESGRRLNAKIAAKFNLNVTVRECDFFRAKLFNENVPDNSVIFTHFALHYLTEIKDDFITSLLQLNPKIIMSLEPIMIQKPNNLLDLMINKYILINGYNTNYEIILNKFVKANRIKILYISPPLLGSNPFLPLSLVIWDKI